MIFLTHGTQLPFDRLARAVDDWCEASPDREVFGQINEVSDTGYRPRHFRWVSHLAPAEFDRLVAAAPFVIAHAGMGSIITAQVFAKTIVVLPRRAELGEQRNDHQLATAERFEGRTGVHVAWRAGDLAAVLDRVAQEIRAPGPAAEPFADQALIAAVREAILQDTDASQATSRKVADKISS